MGSVWSQPARQVHDDKCEVGGDCIIVVYFHGKLDFKPVHTTGRLKPNETEISRGGLS